MTVLHPPVAVAVADPVRELPAESGRWAYEPKFDGYRCLGFAGLGLLQSRQGSTTLTTRFPEVTADLAVVGSDAVLDGELVAMRGGHLEFAQLQAGPARRAHENVTVIYMAFDLLAIGDRDLRTRSYLDRRAALGDLIVRPRPHLQLVEHTLDIEAAQEWMAPGWGDVGVEGVVAKPRTSRYARRCGWLKFRRTHTTEAAVLGVAGADSLVLGVPGRAGGWRVAGISLPVPSALRAEMAAHLRPDPARLDPVRLPGTLGGLPGSPDIVYQPVRPTTVVEIEADLAIEFGRWRHRPRVLRIRADLAPVDLAPPGEL